MTLIHLFCKHFTIIHSAIITVHVIQQEIYCTRAYFCNERSYISRCNYVGDTGARNMIH